MATDLNRLKKVFEANPDKEKLFTAPDGQVFFEEHEAHNHAQRFEKGEATTWTANKVEKALEAEKTEPEDEKKY